MKLPPDKKVLLLGSINKLNPLQVLPFVVSGDITVEELQNAGIMQPKLDVIMQKLRTMPDPHEQEQWKALAPRANEISEECLKAFDEYINEWQEKRPAQNHVQEAMGIRDSIYQQLAAKYAQEDNDDWQKVDLSSSHSILAHLDKYPTCQHKAQADDAIWDLTIVSDRDSVNAYISRFPAGRHVTEANEVLSSFSLWEDVRNSADLFVLNDFIMRYPNSPFHDSAFALMLNLRNEEIGKMYNHPEDYDAETIKKYIKEKIFSPDDLINSGVATQEILDIIIDPAKAPILPDINQAIRDSYPSSKPGNTDVFFFGIPSTGKTCVLMGLTRSNIIHINLASSGGYYASALQQYIDASTTVPRTPGTFVTTLEATIHPDPSQLLVHKVNLVEMSGEEFAFGIANNPNNIYTFESMGTGATELLRNNNRKVFFLIIDPTASVVKIKREVIDHYDEQDGHPIVRLDEAVVNQKILIQKMVDIFADESNSAIMDMVDSIHIIMTKSDRLSPDPQLRQQLAVECFKKNYEKIILPTLIHLCSKHNINVNVTTKFHPRLYTFSLGHFCLGGMYEYDATDSDRLVMGICNSTRPTKLSHFG